MKCNQCKDVSRLDARKVGDEFYMVTTRWTDLGRGAYFPNACCQHLVASEIPEGLKLDSHERFNQGWVAKERVISEDELFERNLSLLANKKNKDGTHRMKYIGDSCGSNPDGASKHISSSKKYPTWVMSTDGFSTHFDPTCCRRAGCHELGQPVLELQVDEGLGTSLHLKRAPNSPPPVFYFVRIRQPLRNRPGGNSLDSFSGGVQDRHDQSRRGIGMILIVDCKHVLQVDLKKENVNRSCAYNATDGDGENEDGIKLVVKGRRKKDS